MVFFPHHPPIDEERLKKATICHIESGGKENLYKALFGIMRLIEDCEYKELVKKNREFVESHPFIHKRNL